MNALPNPERQDEPYDGDGDRPKHKIKLPYMTMNISLGNVIVMGLLGLSVIRWADNQHADIIAETRSRVASIAAVNARLDNQSAKIAQMAAQLSALQTQQEDQIVILTRLETEWRILARQIHQSNTAPGRQFQSSP